MNTFLRAIQMSISGRVLGSDSTGKVAVSAVNILVLRGMSGATIGEENESACATIMVECTCLHIIDEDRPVLQRQSRV